MILMNSNFHSKEFDFDHFLQQKSQCWDLFQLEFCALQRHLVRDRIKNRFVVSTSQYIATLM